MENMRRSLDKLVKLRKEYEYKLHLENSRERMTQSVVTKIRTTMIGALAAMEESFGDEWGHGKQVAELSPEELKNYKIKENMRKRIFDLGNKCIRNFSKEVEQYEINWNKYNLIFEKENENV